MLPPTAGARRWTGEATLDRLRERWVRRLFVALMLCAFVPVASAMVACKVHCAVHAETAPASTASASQEGSDHGKVMAERWTLTKYLKHAGPCHMATVPAAADTRPRPGPEPAAAAWAPDQPARYDSFVWPPPEHRPRG